MNAPVKSDFIISGPNPVNADSINNPPKILPIVQIQLTFNNEFKKLFFNDYNFDYCPNKNNIQE